MDSTRIGAACLLAAVASVFWPAYMPLTAGLAFVGSLFLGYAAGKVWDDE